MFFISKFVDNNFFIAIISLSFLAINMSLQLICHHTYNIIFNHHKPINDDGLINKDTIVWMIFQSINKYVEFINFELLTHYNETIC